jgi:soluble lytic murein transglycosylase-like protein
MSLSQVLVRIQELAPVVAPQAPRQQAAVQQQPTTSFAAALSQAQTEQSRQTAPAQATTDTSSASPYESEIDAAAAQNNLDPSLLASVIAQESGFDPNATSAAGAQGLMQLMPSTAASLGVTNPFDPTQSIDAGARYLRGQIDRFGGDVSLGLAAYNAGAGAVERYGGVPPYAETQNYVHEVLARAGSLATERSAT